MHVEESLGQGVQSVPALIMRGDVRRALDAPGRGLTGSAGRDFAGRQPAAERAIGMAGDNGAGLRPGGGAAARAGSGRPPEDHAHGVREVLGASMPWDTFVREQAEP